MINKINEIVSSGYRPYLYIDDILESDEYIKRVKNEAKKVGLTIVKEKDLDKMIYKKIYVLKYGHISDSISYRVLKKGGIIESANFDI